MATVMTSGKNLIGGEWCDAADGSTMDVLNPATAEVIARVPRSTALDVERAVEAARAALPGWLETTPGERATALLRLADLVDEHADELVELESRNVGKPLEVARLEIPVCSDNLRFFAGAGRLLEGKSAGEYMRGYTSMIRREPIGIVAGITPWNYPLMMAIWKLGPALAAGNVQILKPAEATPLTTLRLAELASEVLPPGVLNVVTGGPDTGEALVAHPGVRRVAFTGQTSTGRRIMELAGPALKHVSLELGGSDPTIVLADADLDAAVKNIQIGRYWNCGQACLAPKRAFVQAEVYDAFLDQLVQRVGRYEPGPGETRAEKPKLRIGPMHTAAQRDLLVAQLAEAVERGAKVLVGGEAVEGPGYFFEPAVVVDAPADSRLATEEVFGPVLPVWKVDGVEEAIERANATGYGLGSSIWTRSAVAIDRATRELEAGVTWVNQLHYGYDELPFGGTKQSGLGREHGLEALGEYTELKSVVVGGLA
jgi:succinate-semialdehyde dehydrogenase / glutarate-semialdehyde dehydrogenase